MLSMLKLLKLLMMISILSTSLFAKTVEESVESFEKRRVMSNPNVQLEDIKLVLKKRLKMVGMGIFLG